VADLKTIGSAKIKSSINKASAGLEIEIKALERRNAAKGNLYSGSTIKEVISICCDSINTVRDEAIKSYEWVIDNSLLINQSLHNDLEKDASNHLEEILTILDGHLQRITILIGMPDLHAKTKDQLRNAYQQALTDISLHLDGSFKAKSNGLIKKSVKLVSGFIAKIFTSPK